jgi:hypothetical protein
MRNESLAFINLLAAREYPQTVALNPFDQAHWFAGAYRTIQRGVPEGTFAEAAKIGCSNLIFGRLPFLAPVTFDVGMETLIAEVAATYPLTIGQAQKLVNILLKYHACLFFSQLDPGWNLAHPWVAAIHERQHVPIDSIVLVGLCRLDPEGCAQFVTASSRFAYSRASMRFVWTHCAYIYDPPSEDGKGPKAPWSGLAGYAAYFRLQALIRELAAAKGVSPLLFEMRFLWALWAA